MNYHEQLRYLQQQLGDIDKQLRALQRLEYAPTLNVVTYSGTPSAGQYAYWTGAGTVAGTASLSDYLPGNGTFNAGDAFQQIQTTDIGDITSTQALTIDITAGAARRNFIVYVDFTAAAAPTNNIFAFFRGVINWSMTDAGTTSSIKFGEYDHETSGTDACTVSTITSGIRIVIDSSAFGGTLNRNTLRVWALENNTALTIATSIA